MNLAGLTLDQLRAATATQIRTRIKDKIDTMTKLQLIRLILRLVDFDADAIVALADSPVCTYQPDRQIALQMDVTRDMLGSKIGSRRVTWTYYPTGEVDIITTEELDANDQVVKTLPPVKHFTDGRQPIPLVG